MKDVYVQGVPQKSVISVFGPLKAGLTHIQNLIYTTGLV